MKCDSLTIDIVSMKIRVCRTVFSTVIPSNKYYCYYNNYYYVKETSLIPFVLKTWELDYVKLFLPKKGVGLLSWEVFRNLFVQNTNG